MVLDLCFLLPGQPESHNICSSPGNKSGNFYIVAKMLDLHCSRLRLADPFLTPTSRFLNTQFHARVNLANPGLLLRSAIIVKLLGLLDNNSNNLT